LVKRAVFIQKQVCAVFWFKKSAAAPSVGLSVYFFILYIIKLNETRFSRLRTQDPRTPGELHETMLCLKKAPLIFFLTKGKPFVKKKIYKQGFF